MQLSRGESLRYHAQEPDLDIAGAQHGARQGVFESAGWQIERILGGQQRARAALELLMRRFADPLDVTGYRQVVGCHARAPFKVPGIHTLRRL